MHDNNNACMTTQADDGTSELEFLFFPSVDLDGTQISVLVTAHSRFQ